MKVSLCLCLLSAASPSILPLSIDRDMTLPSLPPRPPQLNIANPSTGQQHVVEIDDEKRLRAFYDRRISQEVDGVHIGDEFKGYVFRISGGNDKQGFPMKQGVLTDQRVRLLLRKGLSCYRARRKGERKRKSVRGAIVGPDLSVLNLVVVKRGEEHVAGLTDSQVPRRLGPKRANKIRKLFNLSKEDDVTKFAISRKFENKKGKTITKRPNIQRLVTPLTLQVSDGKGGMGEGGGGGGGKRRRRGLKR